MAFAFDPQIGAAMLKLVGEHGPPPPPTVGDVKSRRGNVVALFQLIDSLAPSVTDVATRDFETTAKDGTKLLLRWYMKAGGSKGPGVFYVHGGGMIMCSLAEYNGILARYVSASGVPMLAVEYRLAPEFPHPVPVEDCYAGLEWFAEHAGELGVDPARIAVMGDSAGGGLAAGTALLARDRGGPKLAKQILVYPMLDDRNVNDDPQLKPFLLWSYDDNRTGWGALLGKDRGTEHASPYAAPARAKDLAGLPRTYIDVGDLDLFRDEDLEYARRLTAAGVHTELHLHPGCPHAFEGIAPDSEPGKRALADRVRVLTSI